MSLLLLFLLLLSLLVLLLIESCLSKPLINQKSILSSWTLIITVVDPVENYLVEMGYLLLLLMLLLVLFLLSISLLLSLLLLLLILLLSSSILSLSLFLLLLYQLFCFACTNSSIIYLLKICNRVPQKLNDSYIASFFMENIVLKASHLKHLKICTESNKH